MQNALSESMNIFVTGGSGFLGKQLLARLRETNHKVLALARSSISARVVEELGATPVIGDLSNIENWKDHLNDVNVVIHCAAPVEFWGPWEKFEEEILSATSNLAVAAAGHGVRRFIYISSESVLQDKEPLLDIDEGHPFPAEPNSYYGKAKMLAEKRLQTTSLPMDIVILRPTFIWGIGSPAFESIKAKATSGQFVWIDQGRNEFEAVHVDNVVAAILSALSNGKNKEVYFITDQERCTVREFFDELFQSMGIAAPARSLPGSIAKLAATTVECLWRAAKLKSNPPLSKFELSFVAMPRRYSPSKAQNELKYCPVISRKSGFEQLKNQLGK